MKTRKGEILVSADEQPRNAKIDKIPTLKPAFAKNGTITAANASTHTWVQAGVAALQLPENADRA